MPASPSTALRAHIEARTRKTLIQAGKKLGRLKPSESKTPSQIKSENARKKDLLRAGITHYKKVIVGVDCHTCPARPCGDTPEHCTATTAIHRCRKCGQKVRHYIDAGIAWEYCPACKEAMK